VAICSALQVLCVIWHAVQRLQQSLQAYAKQPIAALEHSGPTWLPPAAGGCTAQPLLQPILVVLETECTRAIQQYYRSGLADASGTLTPGAQHQVAAFRENIMPRLRELVSAAIEAHNCA